MHWHGNHFSSALRQDCNNPSDSSLLFEMYGKDEGLLRGGGLGVAEGGGDTRGRELGGGGLSGGGEEEGGGGLGGGDTGSGPGEEIPFFPYLRWSFKGEPCQGCEEIAPGSFPSLPLLLSPPLDCQFSILRPGSVPLQIAMICCTGCMV